MWKFDGLEIYADTSMMRYEILNWFFGVIYGVVMFGIPFAIAWYFILYEGIPDRWRLPAVAAKLRAWIRGTGESRP